MTKKIIFALAILLSTYTAHAEEKVLFHCTSAVMGFEGFNIFELTEAPPAVAPESPEAPTPVAATKPKYNLKVDMDFYGVPWVQYGEPQVWSETSSFEGQFEKPNPVPGEPIERIYVYIRANGTGSISVYGGLDPITCQKVVP